MIKFRCPFCEQKIAIDDEGAGAELYCPNCTGKIVAPCRSAAEFRPSPVPETAALLSLMPAGEPLNPDQLRNALLPHLAEQLTNRLVQELVTQRRQLLATQQDAAVRIAEFEQRVARLQSLFAQRQSGYEIRIMELEGELAVMQEEKRRRGHETLRRAANALGSEPVQPLSL